MDEKPIQIHHHQQQQHKSNETLKCPRCDSSNTKFCYYNNYSLSQPRHFCKACKRYWTRGGTLRNVPVGGGCRKNKRVKRPILITTSTSNSQLLQHVAANPSTVNPQRNPNTNNTNLDQNPIPSSTTSINSNGNHHLNSLFNGLLNQKPTSYPKFGTRDINETRHVSGRYDHLLQPHMKLASGLVFSSSGTGGWVMANHDHGQSPQNLNFSSYMNSSLYGSGSSFSSTTVASLLASSLDQQQRFTVSGFAAYDGGGSLVKDLRMEKTENKTEWINNNNNNNTNNNFHDQKLEAVVSSDPNSILWDMSTEGLALVLLQFL